DYYQYQMKRVFYSQSYYKQLKKITQGSPATKSIIAFVKKQTVGVYLIKNNKILFLIRKKENDGIHKQGMYLPIGGHVELGEGVEEAAIREVKEEAGISVHSVNLAGIL